MSKPYITFKNKSSCNEISIKGDPNWDDQVLKVNGKVLNELFLKKGSQAVVEGQDWGSNPRDETMVGIMVYEKCSHSKHKDYGFFQMTIGQDKKIGNLDVTDCNTEKPQLLTIEYKTILKDQWNLTIEINDK